jgi:hypothetical protein
MKCRLMLFILLCLGTIIESHSQEYKVAKSASKIILNLTNVVIEGYSGNQIVFSSTAKKSDVDPKEKDLQTINGMGYRDNTGLGISVVEKGTVLEVNEVIAEDMVIKVLVPKGPIVSVVCHKVDGASKVIFKNFLNEIEVETDYNNISLENVTGPVTVRALYGGIQASFIEPIKGPVSMTSIHSTVDVSIPLDTRANINFKSGFNVIMTSPDLKIAVEKNKVDSVASYGSLVYGKLNGGGQDFKLTSTYGKIYLRKAK